MNDKIAFLIEQKKKELESAQTRQNALIAKINPELSEINTLGGAIREITQTLNFLLAPEPTAPPEQDDETDADVTEDREQQHEAASVETAAIPQPVILNRTQRRKLEAEQRKVLNGLSSKSVPDAK